MSYPSLSERFLLYRWHLLKPFYWLRGYSAHQCARCRFYTGERFRSGLCRERSPVVGEIRYEHITAHWPVVHELHWCGRFRRAWMRRVKR
jgi:hypothetical protein